MSNDNNSESFEKNKNELLLEAAKDHNPQALHKLVKEPGININYQDKDGVTALMLASASKISPSGDSKISPSGKNLKNTLERFRECVCILLKAGADINAKDHFGRTALMHVASDRYGPNNGRSEMVELLLLYKPDLYIKDKEGKTAFDHIEADVIKRKEGRDHGLRLMAQAMKDQDPTVLEKVKELESRLERENQSEADRVRRIIEAMRSRD